MQVMLKMNQRMDMGWKLTNSSCEACNGITMTDPNNPVEYYCPKCDKTTEFKFDIEVNQTPIQKIQNDPEEDYFNDVIAESGLFGKPTPISVPSSETPIRHIQNYAASYGQRMEQNTNNVSKKLGEKLLHGWTMLQQSCMDCNVPLMRSKKGEKICCSCERDFAKEQKEQAQKLKKSLAPPTPTPTTSTTNANAQQWKMSQNQQLLLNPVKKPTTTPIEPQNQQILNAMNTNEALNNTIQNLGQKSQDLIESIQCKALRFLDFKIDKAIDQNDISAVEKILSIVKMLKE